MTKLSTKFARAAKRATSLTSAVAIAAVGLVGVAAAPANAVEAQVVKSFDYTMSIDTPGSSVVIPSAVYKRIDFQASFNYDDITSLRGHVITVDSVDGGFTEANRPMNYAYITFKDANNNPVGNGSQINRVFAGQALDTGNSITVPDAAVSMNVNWTSAANISDANYGAVPAGTYSSAPKFFDRGTDESPVNPPSEITYTSDAASTAGLYYDHEVSRANVQGIATNFNLPATGTISNAGATVVGCIDWSKVSANTVATVDFKVNGQTPDYPSIRTKDSTMPYSGTEVLGASLDFSAGDLAAWRSTSKPIYVFAAKTNDWSLTTNGMALDASLDVVDGNNVSILTSCTPAAPTGTGTLGAGSMPGRVTFTPTTFVPPSGEWACNLYKKSDNTLIITGSGWGSMGGCMMGSIGPDAPAIPSGVPLYAKAVVKIEILGQTLSAESVTASNDYTMTSGGGGGGCTVNCGPPPAVAPVGFIAPKVTWPTTSVLKVGTKLTAVKSNLSGTRMINWMRCPTTSVRPVGTVVNGSVFPGPGCEILSSTLAWTPSGQLDQNFRAFLGTTYTVKVTDAGKNFSIIDFLSCTNACVGRINAASKTVKVNDKTEPSIPVTPATLKKGKTLKLANANSQKLAVVVSTTTAAKCTVAKSGTSYVVTGKATGICLVKLAVTGKGFVATANEIHAITIN